MSSRWGDVARAWNDLIDHLVDRYAEPEPTEPEPQPRSVGWVNHPSGAYYQCEHSGCQRKARNVDFNAPRPIEPFPAHLCCGRAKHGCPT